jgi:hypothetical protein
LAKIAERTGRERQAQRSLGRSSGKGSGKAIAPASADENLSASFFQEIRQSLQPSDKRPTLDFFSSLERVKGGKNYLLLDNLPKKEYRKNFCPVKNYPCFFGSNLLHFFYKLKSRPPGNKSIQK